MVPLKGCDAQQVFCSKIGLAPYIEVALYHKKAKALMVTDAVVYIPEDPPEASPALLHLANFSSIHGLRDCDWHHPFASIQGDNILYDLLICGTNYLFIKHEG